MPIVLRHNINSFILVILAALLALPGPLPAQTQKTGPAATPPPSSTRAQPYRVPIFNLPDQVTLCGEKFPLDNPDVYERLDMEFTIVVHGRAQVLLWLKRAGKYFPHIEKRLAAQGLPNDLKYLAVAESDLRAHAHSPAKALGTWQFIAATAKRFGLRKDKNFDDRLSYERSTEAAMGYLRKLKNDFGSWLLAMAAYNCGEGRVRREIKEQGVADYFRMDLPHETERYIYRIAAIKIVLDNPEKYGYSVDSVRTYTPQKYDRVSVNIGGPIHFTRAAKAIGTDYKVLRELNPEIRSRNMPVGSYKIRVPAGLGSKMSAFLKTAAKAPAKAKKAPAKKTAKAEKSSTKKKEMKYWEVKAGDTLAKISRETGVSINTIRNLNKISGTSIIVGQKLRLYQ